MARLPRRAKESVRTLELLGSVKVTGVEPVLEGFTARTRSEESVMLSVLEEMTQVVPVREEVLGLVTGCVRR